MRLTTVHAGCVRTSHAAGKMTCLPCAKLAAVFLFVAWVTGDFSRASVPSAAPRPTPRRGNATVAQGSVDHHAPEMAVVYDDSYRPPAKDLLLTLDGERKADAVVHFVEGLLEEDTQPEQANDQYQKSLALDPGNVDLSVKLAQDYVTKGDVPGAINLLKDTIKAAPKAAKPYLVLGYIYYTQQNKADLAQKNILQALDLDPTQILGYEYLRIIYKATDQAAKIPALLDRAAKTDSDDPKYWLYLGKLFLEQYLTTDAAFTGEPSEKTSDVFQKAFNTGKDDVEVVTRVADFYVATKQFKEAIPIYERAVELDPTQVAPRENLARCYVATEQTDKAIAALEGLIKANPVDAQAYETLAKLYESSGQPDKAIADYEQSLLINPNYVEGYENVTNLLVQQHQAEKAIPILADARKRFPGQPVFSFLLAMTLERTKQHQQALEMYETTETEAQQAMPSLLDSRFYFEFGEAAEQGKLYDRAGTLLKKALELEDDTKRVALISNYLGYMWVDHNLNLEEGGDLIKRALEIDPDNGAYLDSLGWYYYHTNKFEDAVTELTKAIAATKPEDETVAEVYGHLGDAYAKLNNVPKAVEAWQKAADLDPKSPTLPDLKKKIETAKAAPSSTTAPSATPTPNVAAAPTSTPTATPAPTASAPPAAPVTPTPKG